MQAKICAWHKCRAEFEPSHHLQTFCCERCKKDRQNWKQTRGSVLVDLLIDMDAEGLARERRKLLEEINAAQ